MNGFNETMDTLSLKVNSQIKNQLKNLKKI